MARPRASVYEPAVGGGRVWVTKRRGREGTYSINFIDAAGAAHETTKPSLPAAKQKADELAIIYGTVSFATPFVALIVDHLDERRPSHWSDGYHIQQHHLAKRFAPFYGLACGRLAEQDRSGHRPAERAILDLRAAGTRRRPRSRWPACTTASSRTGRSGASSRPTSTPASASRCGVWRE